MIGGTAGGLAVSNVGSGTGNVAAILGGRALVGAVAGAVIEQVVTDRVGIEYVLVLANGRTSTVIQEQDDGDDMLAYCTPVMIQTSGNYQRVLPTANLPSEVSRLKEVKIAD